MLTKKQLNILSVFKKDIFTDLTFKQIKEQSRQKSNNIVQIALKEFQKQGLMKIRKTGDVKTYSLNWGNNLTVSYINLLNEIGIYKNKKLPVLILKDIQNKVSKYTAFFILIVFGSYAKSKVTDKSDMDIAIIVETENAKKKITPGLETIKRREITPIDCHLFTKKEFIDMLGAESENLGKQIVKNNIVYYGFIEYCNIIKGS